VTKQSLLLIPAAQFTVIVWECLDESQHGEGSWSTRCDGAEGNEAVAVRENLVADDNKPEPRPYHFLGVGFEFQTDANECIFQGPRL